MAKVKLERQFNLKDRFINPYNFVEIQQDSCERSDYTDQTEGRSGSITCELITKTPLIIPDTSAREKKDNDHCYYPFMKINGEYIIPGSSIRGPVRSVYETLTNSCFSTMKKDILISQRSPKQMRPGLLKRGSDKKWTLYRAERYLVPTNWNKTPVGVAFSKKELYAFGQWAQVDFSFKVVKNDRKHGGDKKVITSISKHKPGVTADTGYLKIGEPFPRKNFESIFVLIDADHPVCTDQDDIDVAYILFANTLNAYRDPAINRNLNPKDKKTQPHSGYPYYPKELRNTGDIDIIPIWYQDNGTYYYLSPANIGRFTFQNSENSLVKSLDSCNDRENLCKACALFGMVSVDGTGNYASKVRFGDARISAGNSTPEKCELKELASPHVSYIPFYAKSVKGKLQNYDSDYAGIRGRKYYWHHHPAPAYYTNKGPKNERNAEMDLMGGAADKETRFIFKVWFDDITSAQLEDLVWTLTLGENAEDSQRCIKIGHGKPFGFGSCKIIVKEVKERLFDGNVYKEEPADISGLLNSWETSNTGIKNTKTFKQLMTILTFGSVSGIIEYPSVVPVGNGPFGDNDKASHQWFSANYKLGSDEAKYLLPEIPTDQKGAGQVVSLPKVYTGTEPELTSFLLKYQPETKTTSDENQKESGVTEDKAKRAVLVTKDKVNPSSLKRFEGYTIDTKEEWFDQADVITLSKKYGILLVGSARTDNRTLKKFISAKQCFDEVWSYDSKSNTWIKK